MSAPAINTPFGTFGAPPDAVAWASFGVGLFAVAIAAFGGSIRARLARAGAAPWRGLVPCLSLVAAALSAGYVAYYLRGAPRIIDATSYWLEARSFAAGSFDFIVPGGSEASFSGRFLLPTTPGHQAVIFPPGYPAALAPFQLLGIPMWLGPLLAAAIVCLTHACARRLFPRDPGVANWAAVLSVLSAALRYHTADTMSHAWCATLWLGAVYCALRARDRAPERAATADEDTRVRQSSIWQLGSGACLGWLLATRPFTALAAALSLILLARAFGRAPAPLPVRPRGRAYWPLWLTLGALPGAALWLWHQAATSGTLFGSSQLAYYAVADGPAGCFGYGLGARGCLFEHGDFVRSQLPNGFGVWQMLATSARRLKAHLVDSGNLEVFALVLPWVAWRERRSPAVRFLVVSLLLQIAVYAPFYFDGNYPAGGARFYIDALPLEHVLLAVGIASWRFRAWVPGLSLLGFALHTAYDHHSLMLREGGAPMFPSRSEIRAELGDPTRTRVVFVDTDHGFNLGFDPSAVEAWQRGETQGLIVARRSYDSREGLLLSALDADGWFYDFNPHGNGPATWSALSPPPQTPEQRLEAEYDWPPRSVAGGWVHPDWPPGDCVSLRRGLRFRADGTHPTPVMLEGDRATRATLELVARKAGPHRVTTVWARMTGKQTGRALLRVESQRVEGELAFAPGRCSRISLPEVQLSSPEGSRDLPRAVLQVAVTQDDFVLDRIELEAL